MLSKIRLSALFIILITCAAFLAATLPGCIDYTPGNGVARPVPPAWFRGDFHCHTTYSDDARQMMGDDVATITDLAVWEGLEFLAITDHRNVKSFNDPAFQTNKTLLLPGEEWGRLTHAGMTGLSHQVPEIDMNQGPASLEGQVQKALDDCHSQGGLYVINHPCARGQFFYWKVKGFDAVEVWNRPWSFMNPDNDATELDSDLQALGLAAIGFTSNPWLRPALSVKGGGSNYQALMFYQGMLDDGIKIPLVGGGDRHSGYIPGHPSTYVHATSDSVKGILDAVRKGRTWVRRSRHGAMVEFSADRDGDGVFESALGDTLPLGGRIDFRIEVTGAEKGFLEIIRNGQITTVPVTTSPFVHVFSDTPNVYSWYRVDVFEILKDHVPGGQDFATLIQQDPTGLAAFLTNMIVFAKKYGMDFAQVSTQLPAYDFGDDFDRIANLSTRHPGYCRGAMTSPIYAGSK